MVTRYGRLFLLAMLACCWCNDALAGDGEEEDSGDVIVLDKDNFDDGVGGEDIILVEFYAPWCGHCKRLAPEYKKAATVLKSADPPVPLAKVDCPANTELCQRFKVSGYPTLKIFRDGELSSDYAGPRDANGIVTYMKKQSGPSSKELATMEDFEKFVSNKEYSIVALLTEEETELKKALLIEAETELKKALLTEEETELKKALLTKVETELKKALLTEEETELKKALLTEELKKALLTEELKKAFMQAASKLRDSFRFAHTTSEEILSKFDLKDTVVIFQPPQLRVKLEPPKVVYEGKPKERDLVTFVTTKFMGLAGVRDSDNLKYFDAKKPLCVVYFDIDFERNPKGSNYYRNRVMKVAKNFEGVVNFAVSSKASFSHELDQLGLDSKKDVVAGLFGSGSDKYSMVRDFSVDNLEGFVQDYFDGELEPYLKSEPVPENNDGPVTVVVAKNFEEVVNDDTKDVLIEFYAPWCGHCKNLAPKYEELGQKLAEDPSVVIAKCDATANDVPSHFEVRGFPTIYWVPAGDKSKPMKYEGGREVDDFLNFIKKNASNPPVIAGEEKKKKKKKSKKEEL